MIRNFRKCQRPNDVKVLEQRMSPRPCGLTALVPVELEDSPYETGIMWLLQQEQSVEKS